MCPLWRIQEKAFEREEESRVFLCVRQGCNIFLGFELMQAKKADDARRNVKAPHTLTLYHGKWRYSSSFYQERFNNNKLQYLMVTLMAMID